MEVSYTTTTDIWTRHTIKVLPSKVIEYVKNLKGEWQYEYDYTEFSGRMLKVQEANSQPPKK